MFPVNRHTHFKEKHGRRRDDQIILLFYRKQVNSSTSCGTKRDKMTMLIDPVILL